MTTKYLYSLSLTWFLLLSLSGCGMEGVKTAQNAPYTVVNKYHQKVESDYCSQCHLQKDDRYQLKAFDPVAACQDCHPPRGHNHPLKPASPGTGVGLPLDHNQITCLTCHDPHDQKGHPALLRKEPLQLCQSCHQH